MNSNCREMLALRQMKRSPRCTTRSPPSSGGFEARTRGRGAECDETAWMQSGRRADAGVRNRGCGSAVRTSPGCLPEDRRCADWRGGYVRHRDSAVPSDVAVKGELIAAGCPRASGPTPGIASPLERHDRIARRMRVGCRAADVVPAGNHRDVRRHAADRRGGNQVPVFPSSRRLLVDELPEGRSVLREIAQDQIRAVATEILLAGHVLRRRQNPVGIITVDRAADGRCIFRTRSGNRGALRRAPTDWCRRSCRGSAPASSAPSRARAG